MRPDSSSRVAAQPAPEPRRQTWVGSSRGRGWLLVIAVCLSIPPAFTSVPMLGLDPSWSLSLQLAAIDGKYFGKDFVFTYGPLGYLLIQVAVNKTLLLGYDLFVLGSLWAIYRRLLTPRPAMGDALGLVLLAMVTRTCWALCPSAILFTILCFWLWGIIEAGGKAALPCALVATVVLFFGKVNYGLIMVFLTPVFGVGLLLLQPRRRVCGILLLLGFPFLIWLGAMIWHVELPGYLRSGRELIAGYNEAMYAYSENTPFMFALAGAFLAATGIVAIWGLLRSGWREQALFLPLVLLAVVLLFKNAFTRSDEAHHGSFFAGLPLVLAVWSIAWRGARSVRVLMLASLVYPLVISAVQPGSFSANELIQATPLRYVRELFTTPGQENAAMLKASLRANYPAAILPETVTATIGQASVDVMPWESSIAVLNGLNYHPRPVPQSYSVYTPWLDGLNASFLNSTNAPAYILYACAQATTIDGRPAAWDESLTKMALLENYGLATEFNLPMRVLPGQNLDPGRVFVLQHSPRARRFMPVATNSVSLALGQPIIIPAGTNFFFLTLDVKRTFWGKLKAAALSPDMLIACFQYQDGSPGYYRAVLPILKSGVLINRRIESPAEIYNWLNGATLQNMAAVSLDFKTHDAGAFQTPLTGQLVEYRLVENEPDTAAR